MPEIGDLLFDDHAFLLTAHNDSEDTYLAGQFRKVGDIVVVVLTDAAPDEDFVATYHASHVQVQKDPASSFVKGQLVFWNEVDPVAMDWAHDAYIHCGIALQDAAAATTTVEMCLWHYGETLL